MSKVEKYVSNLITSIRGIWSKKWQIVKQYETEGLRETIALNTSGAINLKDFAVLVPVMIILLIVIIVYSIIPNLGAQLDASWTVDKNGTDWADAPSGAVLWTDTGAPMIQVVIMLLFVTMILGALIGIVGKRKGWF